MAQLLTGTRIYGTGTVDTQLFVNGTNSATSTTTGALQVVGGVGIGGKLYVGDTINGNLAGGSTGAIVYQSNSNITAFLSIGSNGQILQSNGSAPVWIPLSGVSAGSATTATHLSGGVAGQIPYQTAPGVTAFLSTGTAGDVLVSNGSSAPTYNNTLTLRGTTAATSTATGALVVAGGVGIGQSLFVQENIVQVGETHSTLATTYNLINTTATTVNFAGAATSLNVGATSGSTNVRNNLTVSGNLTVQGTTTIVDSTVTNIADPIITLGGGTGNTAPTADDNKDRGVAFKWVNNSGTTSTGFFGYDDSTGYLTYVPTATITNEVVSGTKGAMDVNLAGGTEMSIHYQSAADTTAFLAAGSSGYLLQTNGTGSAPTWVSASGVSAGSATNADNIRTIAQTASASYYPTFVDSNNASNAYESLYTTGTFVINPATGYIGMGTASPGRPLHVVSIGTATQGIAAFEANSSGLVIQTNSGQNGNVEIVGYKQSSSTYHNILLRGSSSGLLVQNTTGNVGIGNLTPIAKLHIGAEDEPNMSSQSLFVQGSKTGYAGFKGLPQGQLLIYDDTASTAGSGGAIGFGANTGAGQRTWIASINSERDSATNDATNYGGSLAFYTRPAQSTPLERMRIISTGTVVINPGGSNQIGPMLDIYGGGSSTYGALRLGDGSVGAHTNWWDIGRENNFTGDFTFALNGTEKLRITIAGGITFGTASGYGSSGQILKSNGNAAPTWVDQNTISSGSPSLTNTYVGYGSASNLLTGSANLTWNGSTLSANGSINAATSQLNSFNAQVIGILGVPNLGTHVGYLLLAKAYISGLQSSSSVNGEFAIKRGGVSSGNRAEIYRVSSNSGYNTEGFVVQVTSGSGIGDGFFVSTVKVTYSGIVYHAIKTTVGGGDPDNGIVFYGSSYNAGMLYVDATYISAESSFGSHTFLNSAGNLGIGTSSPGDKLDVQSAGTGGININNSAAGTENYIRFRSVGVLKTQLTSNYADGNFYLYHGGINAVVVGNTGSVGIGIVATERFHVFGTANGAATQGPRINLQYSGTSGAAESLLQFLDFRGAVNASMGSNLQDDGAGTAAAEMVFKTATAGTLTERLRINRNGAIAFSGAASYGSSGQILQSNGNAAPTWVNQNTISSGSAPLTNTYVGYGSASNLLTGSSSLTWNGTTLYVNGRIQNPSYTTYNVTTIQQGNVNSTYEIMRIGRDSANWSHNMGYEVTVRSEYYSSGGATKWYITYGYGDAGAISCMDARGGTKHRVYLGTEVTVSGNIKYIPVYVDIPNYYNVAIEVKYSTTEVTTFTGSNQVYFTGTMAVGTGALYGGDTHLVPNGGNVGIGITNPRTLLQVAVPSQNYVSFGNTSYGAGDWYGIHVGYCEGGNVSYRKHMLAYESINDGAARGNLHLLVNTTYSSASATIADSKLMISGTTGNVGIGTTSPIRPLQVGAHGSGNGEIALGASTTGYNSILFGDSSANFYQGYVQYQHNGDFMLFATAATERMRITSLGGISFGASGTAYGTSGKVLQSNGDAAPTWVDKVIISDTAPSGTINSGELWWESDTGRLKIYYNDGTSSQWVDVVPVVNTSLFFSKTGGAISGPVSINGALDVTGNITATAEITAYYSDRRLKTDVLTIENALVKVKKLNGVTYRPNALAKSYGLATNSDVVGLFADEVEQVLPQAVKPAPFDIDEHGNSKSGENYKTIQYEKVVPLLVEAIKEQQSIIEAQQAKINRLMKHLGLED